MCQSKSLVAFSKRKIYLEIQPRIFHRLCDLTLILIMTHTHSPGFLKSHTWCSRTPRSTMKGNCLFLWQFHEGSSHEGEDKSLQTEMGSACSEFHLLLKLSTALLTDSKEISCRKHCCPHQLNLQGQKKVN